MGNDTGTPREADFRGEGNAHICYRLSAFTALERSKGILLSFTISLL